jgi:hypothetical protein
MTSSGMLCRVGLVITGFSVGCCASFIRVSRISELGTTLAVYSNRRTLMMEALSSSETSVVTRATRRNISEDTILQIYGNLCCNITRPTCLNVCENLRSRLCVSVRQCVSVCVSVCLLPKTENQFRNRVKQATSGGPAHYRRGGCACSVARRDAKLAPRQRGVYPGSNEATPLTTAIRRD